MQRVGKYLWLWRIDKLAYDRHLASFWFLDRARRHPSAKCDSNCGRDSASRERYSISLL